MCRNRFRPQCSFSLAGPLLRIGLLLLLGGPALLCGASGPKVPEPSTKGPDEHVVAQLMTDVTAIAPGQTFEIGILYEMDPHWHIYWKNPGDTGIPTHISWDLPDGFAVGDLRWPTPGTYLMAGLMNYVYEDSVLLAATVTAPDSLQPGESVTLQADTDWLVCEEVCIPGDASLSLQLPVVETPGSGDPETKPLFDRARDRLPVDAPAEATTVYRTETGPVLFFSDGLLEEGQVLTEAYFFEDGQVVDPNAPQVVNRVADGYLIRLEASGYGPDDPASLPGVLVLSGDGFRRGFTLEPAFSEGTPPTPTAADGADADGPLGLTRALLFGLVGGLLLNLMPCVFPVLGLKVMGFVQQAGGDAGRIRAHGWTFALGVLVSIWMLVGVLLALRAGGELIGWGFQLQTPGFVAFLVILFFLFGLSLAGVFEIGGSLMGRGDHLARQEGLSGSFFSGVLAVLVATPCTAPFMGPAIGVALTQGVGGTLAIFTTLALGLSLPYLVLAHRPAWIQALPRPGPWMETFKQVMAFPLFATAVWLIWVFGLQTGVGGMAWLLGSLTIFALGAWILGKWGTAARSGKVRRAALIAVLVLAAGGIWSAGVASQRQATTAGGATVAERTGPGGLEWIAFSRERLAELRAAGKTVYVDFTAAWCLTCQANKKTVFSSDAIVRRFAGNPDLVLMEADWTRRNPEITEVLQEFGRAGVPLNVIYPAKPGTEPVVLPTVLTPGIVQRALDEVLGS
ncbi:MAG: protein-disulfide reductase DsbD family protein [Opitutales bacterium]